MNRGATVGPLVDGQWLQDNLQDPELQIIENAWVPEAYLRAHIPGAVRVPCHPHLKRFDTAGQKTRHVMSAVEFEELCRDLGLRRDRHCVVYDDYHGLFGARFRAVCRYYGFDKVSVLDGGWYGWLSEGRPLSAREELPTPGTDIAATVRPELFVGLDELKGLQSADAVQIWDTRRSTEFDGSEETENLRRGHMPGALNLSWTELLTGNEDPGTPRYLKPLSALADQLAAIGLQQDKTIITYCQSGIRAAFCLLVLEQLGFSNHRLYDGSMGEWCNWPETALVTPTT